MIDYLKWKHLFLLDLMLLNFMMNLQIVNRSSQPITLVLYIAIMFLLAGVLCGVPDFSEVFTGL